ncbi:MAG: hypothetical protein WBJ52_09285 [Methanoregulaceae archaeon]
MERKIEILSNIIGIITNIVTISPLIVFLLAGIWSYISTGNFFDVILAIPYYVWTVLLLISIFILIIKRKEKIKQSKSFIQRKILFSPDFNITDQLVLHGTTEVAEINYNEAKWKIHKLNDSLYLYILQSDPIESLLIEIPPKCLNCNTDLLQRLGFWGGYVWECKRCNKSIKSLDSFQIIGSHALAVAKSEIKDKRDT